MAPPIKVFVAYMKFNALESKQNTIFNIQLDIALVVVIQKTDFGWFVTNDCSASPRHVGTTGRPLIWRPSDRYTINFFVLEHSWRTFLRARAQTADNFRKNNYLCRT
jgi:hypothetical protein